jgi:serine/threonine protein kinase
LFTEIFDLNPDHYPSCLFSYDELKSSTRNFHRGNKIGEGAFGPVYKVYMPMINFQTFFRVVGVLKWNMCGHGIHFKVLSSLLDKVLYCWQGTMRDGSEVAVKGLPSNIKQSNRDFLNEVELISALQHKNPVESVATAGCLSMNTQKTNVSPKHYLVSPPKQTHHSNQHFPAHVHVHIHVLVHVFVMFMSMSMFMFMFMSLSCSVYSSYEQCCM